MVQIQETDEFLAAIKHKINCNTTNNGGNKFCIEKGVLFKRSTIYNEIIYRLCLPVYLGREILQKLHDRNSCHITGDNLRLQFENNFYVHGCRELIKKLSQSCLLCQLNEINGS